MSPIISMPTLLPNLPGFVVDEIRISGETIMIEAHSCSTQAQCPQCGMRSTRIHSRYLRCPQDLPCSEKSVRLQLTVKRFRCVNQQCPRCTFAERLPELVEVNRQRTRRCEVLLTQVGLAASSECGAKLSRHLKTPVSADTLLGLLRRIPAPQHASPRLLGVDDWAWRKGTQYGTVLCDLERGQIIDILPDRERDTLVKWLQQHPGVELITRDRSKPYSEAATLGAPQAQQVADRWHLLKNLREKLQTQLRLYKTLLRWLPTLPPVDPNAEPLRTDTVFEQRRMANHQRRVARHEQILTLYDQRYDVHEIAHLLGISTRTVYRWLEKSVIPERRRYLKRETQIAPFADYVTRRWQEGCRSARELHPELQRLGFTGQHQTVDTALRRLDRGLTVLRTPPPKPPKAKRLTPAQAVWLLMLPAEKLAPEQQQALTYVLQEPLLAALYELAQRFCRLIRERQSDALLPWMEEALKSDFKELVSFVHGLHQDLAAVQAALTTNWSNGPVEGHVNRLKLVKRQMYGRAGFDLLRIRLLCPV
jgi:transposase